MSARVCVSVWVWWGEGAVDGTDSYMTRRCIKRQERECVGWGQVKLLKNANHCHICTRKQAANHQRIWPLKAAPYRKHSTEQRNTKDNAKAKPSENKWRRFSTALKWAATWSTAADPMLSGTRMATIAVSPNARLPDWWVWLWGWAWISSNSYGHVSTSGQNSALHPHLQEKFTPLRTAMSTSWTREMDGWSERGVSEALHVHVNDPLWTEGEALATPLSTFLVIYVGLSKQLNPQVLWWPGQLKTFTNKNFCIIFFSSFLFKDLLGLFHLWISLFIRSQKIGQFYGNILNELQQNFELALNKVLSLTVTWVRSFSVALICVFKRGTTAIWSIDPLIRPFSNFLMSTLYD